MPSLDTTDRPNGYTRSAARLVLVLGIGFLVRDPKSFGFFHEIYTSHQIRLNIDLRLAFLSVFTTSGIRTHRTVKA